MKNKILKITTIFLLLLMPIQIFASTKENSKTEYKSQNLIETFKEEEIELSYSAYEENEKQITIYMFRGKGCGYCKSFLNFLNSITEEYGKYFKLESYDVWYNQNNSELMKEVSNFLEQPATGVPYVIIGDKVFPGYAESYDEEIKTAIKELYNSKDRYDVFKEIKKEQNITKIKNIINMCTLPISIIGMTFILIYTDKKYRKLNKRISELEEIYTTRKNEDNNKNKEENNKTKKNKKNNQRN